MNTEQTSRWLATGQRLGIEVIAPCRLVLSDGSRLEATALVKVGPPGGMVVDAEWSVLEPHADQLVRDGYGYSAVAIGEDDDLSDLIQDWAAG